MTSPNADTAAGSARRSAIEQEIDALIEEYFELEAPPADEDCPLSVPLYGADEVTGAVAALLSQNVTMGDRVREFEAAFAEAMGSRHAIMVNSGSSANLLAISVLAQKVLDGHLKPGDEIIVPAIAWSTTIAPILQLGCVPVFVDIDEDTLNMRPESIDEALSDRTRAVFPVHLLGNPVDMEPLMQRAREHGLWVVEDTCESLGTEIGGRKVGSFGDFGTYSFYFSHHITTIEGGMVVTDDPVLNDLARSLRAHGWSRDMSNRPELESANPEIDPRFLFVNVGYNLRPMETQAAFGLAQLKKLSSFNDARRVNAHRLAEALHPYSDRLRLINEQEGGRSTWFGFSVITDSPEQRVALTNHLEARNIATRPIVAGNLALQPAFSNNDHRKVGSLEVATRVGERGLFIGNHPSLTDGQIAHIAQAFRDFYDG
ncbi:MAG: DegT/DnrJ/EryC1/StrS family aminotransferase [Thermoleophilaceae bacterium]|nr:DegT/DnrJ/EryC1/StrS family aminotransferase [Thermoleophilaceae bacterium]